MTADEGNNPKDLVVEQAVTIACKHRDQLLKGVKLLKQLPPNGNDADYQRLQEELDRQAPDVSDRAWGHKYFHLLFPDKLDHLHNPELQRFHLLKLLQRPPDGKGRYLCAGRFVAAANELDVPMNNLMEVLYSVGGSPYRYWRIGTRGYIDKEDFWPDMRDGNCVAVGWSALGDLSKLEKTKESREQLRQLIAEKEPGRAADITRSCNQLFNFVLRIAEGDLVVASDGLKRLGIGRVTGPYFYHATSGFQHRRPVQWLTRDEWKMPESEGQLTTVWEFKKYINILEVERRVQVRPTTSSAPTAASGWKRRHSPPARKDSGADSGRA